MEPTTPGLDWLYHHESFSKDPESGLWTPSHDEPALVLWLDMLGYRQWLFQQPDLTAAESQLLDALRLMYTTLSGGPSRLSELAIRTTLISDTIIIWSFRWHLETWVGMHTMYHVLASQLGRMGLPLRGALSLGKFRIRDQEPRILLGNAVIYCATLEPTLEAFVVAVDDPVVERLRSIESTAERESFMSLLSLKNIPTKAGIKRLLVFNWMIAVVPHALVATFRDLVRKFEGNDREAVLGLMKFLPKFLNSKDMIDTLLIEADFREMATNEWKTAIRDAEDIWDTVFVRGTEEIERREAAKPR